MLCLTRLFAGGAVSRRSGRGAAAAAASTLSSSPVSRPPRPRRSPLVRSPRPQEDAQEGEEGAQEKQRAEASRLGGRTEGEVMQLAQRMQQRDLTGEVPVASFAYEILKAHPSVRQMGLRERMAFLCDRWERLGKKERQSYLDDPLRGLL